MQRNLKILLIVLTVIGIGLIALCAWGYRMVTRSLPETRGELDLPGLYAEVQVFRDGYHIPHILAKNEHDLFFAQGFITAQDRLWQMDLWRRIARGRLSEIFGQTTLKTDSLMLTIGIWRTARRIAPHLSSESQRIFQAYADGVNAYIQKYSNRLPIEFTLLNYKPSPWQVEDCLAISRWFAWNSSTAWKVDITLGAIVEKIGMGKAKELFPEDQRQDSSQPHWEGLPLTGLFGKYPSHAEDEMFPNSSAGSNCWVVSGDRSVTGRPILANDPHLALTNPSVFYENHLVGGGFNVSGVSIPGLPGVIIGHNDKIAWGLTNLMADDLDLFVEQIDPNDPTKYLYGKNVRKAEIITEEIPIRGNSPIQMRILRTHHGPIVSDVLQIKSKISSAISVRWTGHETSDEGLAFYHLNRAEDWESFREALTHYKINPQAFIYADREGNIGVQAAGKIPVKIEGIHFLPRAGEDPAYDWKSEIPFDALPSLKNPEKGVIATANDKLLWENASYASSGLWALPSRIRRIQQLLSEKENYSMMDFNRIQADVHSIFAKEFIELVLSVVRGISFDDSVEQELVKNLSGWDGQMKAGSPEAALCETLLGRVMKNLFLDEIGDSLYSAFVELHGLPLNALSRLLAEESSPWFDNVKTSHTVETKKDIIKKSYRDAITFLKEQLGEDVSKWTWGALHTLVFKHPLGKHPLLAKTFNMGPFHVSGSGTTVNCTAYNLKKPYDVVGGASARLIIDLGNPDNSISVIPTGQSGQPLDEHYRDQLQLYLGNLYHPNLMDTTKIIQSGWDLLKLQPGGPDD